MTGAPLTHEEFWRKYDAVEARLAAGLSQRMLDLAQLQSGMCLLDIASGRGEPAIPAAHRVAPTGAVLGVDLSDGLLTMARERAAAEKLSNIEFIAGNAETTVLENRFHAATCRWGLMYMNKPVDAMRNVHRALLPGARFVSATWAEREKVDYFTWPRELLAKYRSIPPIDPQAPGVFYYATAETIERDLRAAGFELTEVEEMYVPVIETDDTEDLLTWVRGTGLAKLAAEISEDQQRAWEDDVREAATSIKNERGLMQLGGVTLLAVAVPRIA